MELPKNITQIGEVSRDCKIYVEDYVVSYMKQLNQAAQDKGMAVALYGKRQTQEGISYHFLYGACKLDFLQREVRHLSQAQQQEIEKLRKKYFPELEFMGYRILNGEMIEGLHLCEQDICRYIGGYARFYEKNDAMLAYMLDVREQAEPEKVDQTKYEEVKRRQEERRSTFAYPTRDSIITKESREEAVPILRTSGGTASAPNLQRMRMAAVGAFALLCLLGIGTFREEELTGSQDGNMDVAAVSGTVEPSVEQQETLLMEDKLEQALLEENQSKETDESVQASESENSSQEQTMETEQESEAASSSMEQPSVEATQPKAAERENMTRTSQEAVAAVAYIVQPGDTLINICLRQYGNDARMTDVCDLNDISNPDDIKEGQVIMLPR